MFSEGGQRFQGHGQSIELRPDEYARLFHDFLDRYTTDF
jgi:hypothetical protein